MADKNSKDMQQRIQSESRAVKRICNNDLECKDCVFRVDDSESFGNTSVCRKFGLKPNKVLLGGKCDGYKKE